MSKYNNRTIRVTLTLLVVFVVSSDFLNVFVTAKATDCQEESDDRSNKCHTIENQTSQTSSSSLQDVTLHTSKPAPKPKSLNMLAEDQLMDTAVFRPTPVPLMSAQTKDNITSKPIDNPKSNNTKLTYEEPEPKGRALNFTIDEQSSGNVLSNSTANHHDDFDLSDVTIRDDEDDDEMFSAKILAPNNIHRVNTTLGICEKGGLTYENGEKLEIGCDSICTCLNGKMDCTDRCFGPLFRKGKKNLDPLCITKDSDDPCCSVLLCAGDTETEPLEMCLYENKTYNRGDKFNKGCLEVCTCEIAGKLSCKPRCPVPKKTSDRCVEVPDPKDSCCKQVLCDVSLDDHEHDLKDEELKETKTKLKLTSAKYVNSSAILLSFDSELDNNNLPIVEVSNDKHDWSYYKMLPNGYLFVRDVVKYLRLENTDDVIEVKNDNFSSEMNDKQNVVSADDGCVYKGKTFLFGQEHNDECESLCVCQKNGMKCLKLECPTYFGVDVLDPNCIEWETIPPNFQPKSPDCCPEKIQCKNNGSCEYEGQTYKNWEQLPINVTGCDKRCYCEMGKVECQNSCPPVTALPPPTLPCSPSEASVAHTPDDDCCMYWVCTKQGGFANNFPGPFPNHPGFQQPQDDITVHTLEPVDSHTVRLAFMVPPVIVGLHGRVEVRYTHDIQDDDVSSWNLQVFAPPNDLIATPTLEFDLLDLKADTEYRIKITITLRDLQNTPTSRIYKIKTLKEVQTSTTPPVIPIEPDLSITDINATWVTVMWRKFNEYELQFIDGVQLRFKEIEGKIYAATPLIHRAVTSYTLENLKSNTKYEIGIYFIPFPGQQTELHAKNLLHFSTANEIDTYGFSVSLEISQIKSTSVEISWAGVPYPEDKYVNIYRAIYQSDSGKEDHSTFKIAKRDSPTKSVIMDLKPGTRYRLWLEVYLTNGKIKTSNVQDFVTKPRVTPALGSTTSQDKLSRAELLENGKGDYYGPLVIVGILAALAILSTLILLMILVKRHNQNKAAITPPSTRISQSAYDNPTYKVEIQQETMGL